MNIFGDPIYKMNEQLKAMNNPNPQHKTAAQSQNVRKYRGILKGKIEGNPEPAEDAIEPLTTVSFTFGEIEAIGSALMSAKNRLRNSGMQDEHTLDLLFRLESAYLKIDQ